MLFSILIANYNNSRFLGNALDSLLAQSYSGWEVILVDDASSDGFEEAIWPFAQDKRISVFRNDRNYGCGYTKRECAARARGAILAFLDPDDALAPDALEIMATAHRRHPECSLIHSTHYICDARLNIKRVADYPRPLPPGTPYLMVSDGSIHAFATFKKACYDRTEGISAKNTVAVDQDLYYRLEETGPVLFIDKPLYYYRIHEGSISNAGKERRATLRHYAIIREACQRRRRQLDPADPLMKAWRKKYRTRYYKILIFQSFRERRWLQFIFGLSLFPFVGGGANCIAYLRKLPKEGMLLLRRSFVEDYKIRV